MESRELLIIDDDESIHKVLVDYLCSRGFSVYSAFNGREGLDLLRRHPSIHLVITDVRIPGADGLEVLTQIKQRYPQMQVVLMTAFSDKNLAIRAFRQGADDFLEKPFHLDDLGEVLERSVSRQHLRSLSRRWRQLLEHLPLGLVICSPDGMVEGVTPAAQLLLNSSLEDIVGRPLWEVPGLEAAKTFQPQDTPGTQSEVIEVSICGRWIVVQPVETGLGSDIVSTFFVVSDITEEKALQSELSNLSKEFEARVEERTQNLITELEFSQQLLDTAGVLIAVLDGEGKLVRLNKFAEEISRFNRREAEHVFSHFVQHPESPLSRIFDPRSTEELAGLIADLPTRDGSMRIISWSTRNFVSRQGMKGRLIVGIDVTEQKQLESMLKSYNVQLENMVESRSLELRKKDAQLIHTARLASLGEIAAGITHEMKQPLNVISITADLIKLLHKNRTLTDDLLLSNLEKIRRTVDRMATTMNHLRGFTHIDSANFKPFRIQEAVDGALSIIGQQIRLDDIDISLEMPDQLPKIQGELHQIEQVLVNLMQNARDAIVGKMQAMEATGTMDGAPKRLAVRGGARNNGREVYVEVEDTGSGVDAAIRERIFEPFFTTKEADRGTGLGLSISMNIVQSHGGAVELESTPGQGSTFRVIFPAAPSE
ncbi:MAG TPA: response regulator [bacterium]|jgi:PAS domain S-box-containing protein